MQRDGMHRFLSRKLSILRIKQRPGWQCTWDLIIAPNAQTACLAGRQWCREAQPALRGVAGARPPKRGSSRVRRSRRRKALAPPRYPPRTMPRDSSVPGVWRCRELGTWASQAEALAQAEDGATRSRHSYGLALRAPPSRQSSWGGEFLSAMVYAPNSPVPAPAPATETRND
jgi:hypothetical protein